MKRIGIAVMLLTLAGCAGQVGMQNRIPVTNKADVKVRKSVGKSILNLFTLNIYRGNE